MVKARLQLVERTIDKQKGVNNPEAGRTETIFLFQKGEIVSVAETQFEWERTWHEDKSKKKLRLSPARRRLGHTKRPAVPIQL